MFGAGRIFYAAVMMMVLLSATPQLYLRYRNKQPKSVQKTCRAHSHEKQRDLTMISSREIIFSGNEKVSASSLVRPVFPAIQ